MHLPARYARPRLTVISTLAELPDAHLRDPTTALFDPVGRRWHIFCTHIPLAKHTTAGYPGTVWHFVSHGANLTNASTPGNWEDAGQAVNVSGVPGLFDAGGVFTPGAVVDCGGSSSSPDGASSGGGQAGGTCTWYLWFGGVRNGQNPAHNESIGLATSNSPWGPWKRDSSLPVLSNRGPGLQWCQDGPVARIDEIKPTIIQGRRYLMVKSVCTNGTAIPVFYQPVAPDSWAPPYRLAPPSLVRDPM